MQSKKKILYLAKFEILLHNINRIKIISGLKFNYSINKQIYLKHQNLVTTRKYANYDYPKIISVHGSVQVKLSEINKAKKHVKFKILLQFEYDIS